MKLLALNWDFSEHVTDVVAETHRIAQSRREVGVIVADHLVQEIDVTYHLDLPAADVFSKQFASVSNVSVYYVNRNG